MATYYVNATGGDDGRDGLSEANAWQTLSKVSGASFSAGDSVLLKRGETWAEALTVPSSGAVGNPISFGAYGIGTPPKITGGAIHGVVTNGQDHLRFHGWMLDGKQIYVGSSTNVAISYCVVKNSGAAGIYASLSQDVSITNVVLAGNTTSGLLADGATTTVSIRNSIVVGNGGPTDAAHCGVRATNGAAVTYSYCLITGNAYRASQNVDTASTDGGGNRLEVTPRILSPINGNAYFVLSCDDADTAYVDAVFSILEAAGGLGTFFVIPTQMTPAKQTVLADLDSRGHEIAIHGWSHVYGTATDAFTVTSTNTNPTVEVDVAGSQIILSCDEVGNRVTQSFASDETIANLQTSVSGKGWTITLATGTGVTNVVKLSSLATTGGALSCPRTLTFDKVAPDYAFWREEFSDTSAWIDALVGGAPTVMAWPYGQYNDAMKAWAKDVLGLAGARSSDSALQRLASVGIYSIANIRKDADFLLGDGSESSVRARTRHYIELCRELGGIFSLYVHNTADLTLEQVGWVVDEVTRAGGTWQTFGAVVAAIRSSHATADGLTYTKAYADASDFQLLLDSPALSAGIAVGETADILGRTVKTPPDIGAYQVQQATPAPRQGGSIHVGHGRGSIRMG